MNRVMQIGAADDLLAKAEGALNEAMRQHQMPIRWLAGRETYDRIRHQRDSTMLFGTLFGIRIERKDNAPPDLLELDAF